MFIRALTLTVALALPRLAPAQTTLHVDPACGDDTWTGLSTVCAAPDGPKRTILAAMAAAVSGDEVVLADGVYRPIDEEGGPIDFAGRELTLRSRSGPENCIIWTSPYGSGSYFGRTVLVQDGAAGQLIGLTFLGGEYYEYGAVLVNRATLVVENCTFQDCSDIDPSYSSYGSAVYADLATASFHGCRFESNGCGDRFLSASSGGAVAAGRSSLEFYDCLFRGNRACADMAAGVVLASGGAVAASDDLLFERCRFVGNFSSASSGAISAGGQLVMRDCLFEGNSASEGGGGAVSAENIMLERCVFVGNSAYVRYGERSASGGAVLCRGELQAHNCVFVGNSGLDEAGNGAYGGAVLAQSGSITNSTFIKNTTKDEGGAIAGGSMMIIANCVARENAPDQIASADVTYSNIQGGYPGEGNIDADPLFLDPAARDFRLSPGSPCIDAGDSSSVPAGITLDLAGLPRFRDDPRTPDTGKGPAPIVDMGAYEFQPPCSADCDGDGDLTFFDFLCFQNLFFASAPGGDCDGSGVHDFFDFLCFQNAFAAGCP